MWHQHAAMVSASLRIKPQCESSMENLAKFVKTHLGWLILAVSALLTWAAYGRVLSFPFLFDDLIHLRWLEGRGVLEPWINARGMQHYRPLVFSIWAASGRLFGPHNAWPLHLLTLLLHVANACLVGWLARQVIGASFGAIAAASLFATFPFSYQVIPSPGSQSKPLSTFLILLACALYWSGRSRRQRVSMTLSLLCALLAPFAYEAAVTSGGFLVLMEFLLWHKRIIRRPSPWALLLLLLCLPFMGAWAAVPSSYDPLSFPGWEALWQSSIYFLQAFTWPLALLAKPLMNAGLTDGIATAWVVYSSFAALALLALWRRHVALLVASLSWCFLALIVQWVTLSFRYVIDGPRILYTASVGMALLWADLATTIPAAHVSRRAIGRAVGAIALAAMVGWGLRFSRDRIAMCESGLSVLKEAAEVATIAGETDSLLFVNVPSWLAPRDSDFALGHEGYTILPSYYNVGLDDFLYVNSGVKRTIAIGSLADIRREWRALIGYHGGANSYDELSHAIRRADRVLVLGYGKGAPTCKRGLHLVDAGGLESGDARKGPKQPDGLALFGQVLALQDVISRPAGGDLIVELWWRAIQTPDPPYTVFVHLYAGDEHLVTQADGLPLGGTFPFRLWHAGDVVRDLRYIALPKGLDLRGHSIGVGIYRTDTGDRAAAVGPGGESLEHNMYRLEAVGSKRAARPPTILIRAGGENGVQNRGQPEAVRLHLRALPSQREVL